jgi:hypothetical protein
VGESLQATGALRNRFRGDARSTELVDRPRPAPVQAARARTTGKNHAVSLAARAVVALVLRVHDALRGRAVQAMKPIFV